MILKGIVKPLVYVIGGCGRIFLMTFSYFFGGAKNGPPKPGIIDVSISYNICYILLWSFSVFISDKLAGAGLKFHLTIR